MQPGDFDTRKRTGTSCQRMKQTLYLLLVLVLLINEC